VCAPGSYFNAGAGPEIRSITGISALRSVSEACLTNTDEYRRRRDARVERRARNGDDAINDASG
jgi:hypothetical protein